MRALGIDSETDFAEIKETKELVKESIRRILWTRKGERPNRISFGVGLEEFLFTSINEIENVLKEEILSQLDEYEPRIAVKSIDFNRTGENSVQMIINYYIREFFKDDEFIVVEL